MSRKRIKSRNLILVKEKALIHTQRRRPSHFDFAEISKGSRKRSGI